MPKKLLRIRLKQRRGKTQIIKEGLVGKGQKYRISTVEVDPSDVRKELAGAQFWADVDVRYDPQ